MMRAMEVVGIRVCRALFWSAALVVLVPFVVAAGVGALLVRAACEVGRPV